MAFFETPLAFLIGPLGVQELMIILVIALVIFGGKKIPELGRGLGDGIRQFKSSLKGDDQEAAATKEEENNKAS